MSKDKNDKSKASKVVGGIIVVIVAIIVIVSINGGDNEPKKVDQNNTGTTSEQKADKSEKTEFKVGDVIAFDGREVTVTSVKRNYSTGNEFATPKAGKEFVKVNIKIENKSDDKLSYNTLDWEMQDSSGSIEGYMDAMMAQADDNLGSGDLAKGGKKAGSIVFEVPKGDKGLILHFKSSFWSDKSVEIKL